MADRHGSHADPLGFWTQGTIKQPEDPGTTPGHSAAGRQAHQREVAGDYPWQTGDVMTKTFYHTAALFSYLTLAHFVADWTYQSHVTTMAKLHALSCSSSIV